jgi:predicted MFS family arabinose efflux permease
VVTVLALVAFVFVEHRAAEPIMPLTVFRNRNFTLAGILSFIVGFAMFGGMTFLPQFQQFVQGASATNSGLLLMPMMIAMMATSLAGGTLISKTGHYRALPIAGTVLMAVGLALFATMGTDTSRTMTSLYMVVLGAGMGCLMQTTMLIAQSSAPLRDVGAATGAATFLRNMGGSLGVSILGSVYAHTLTESITTHAGPAAAGNAGSSAARMTPELLRSLPDTARHLFQQAVTDGIGAVFTWGAVVAGTGLLVALAIRHVPLRGFAAAADKPAPAADVTAERVEAEPAAV